MKVTAKEPFSYNGKRYAPGEVFEMKDNHARIFIVNNRVTAVHDDDDPKPKKKGRYGRRDMRADGE